MGHLRLRGLIVTLAAGLLLAACDSPPFTPTRSAHAPEDDTKPAAPALVIGLVPEHNLFRQLERFQRLQGYLERRVGVPIRFKVLSRYGNIVENFTRAEMQGAFFGSFIYALTHRQLGVIPLARPVDALGRSTYFGVVLVRRDSGISRCADLKGRRFAFVDPATTAGYLLPLDYFAHCGVTDFRKFLGEYYFAGTHEDAIRDVLDGKADAGAAKSTVIARLGLEDPRIASELTALARSDEVPENTLAVLPSVDPGLRESLRSALLGMDQDPEGREVLMRFGAARFVPTRDEDYEPVYRYAREVGIDLEQYDYRSDR